MIYIPIELQLKWIREDLEEIKAELNARKPFSINNCAECAFAKEQGFSQTCTAHAPELNMRIMFPL